MAAAYGLMAAVWAWVQTGPGTVARDRARLVASASGIRDTFVAVTLILHPAIRPIPFWGDFIYNPAQGLVYLIYVSILAYGILRSQVLDIELKVKFALIQSVAGALLAASFFVLSEAIEALLPVQGVVPGVEPSRTCIGTRRAQIYRAALEGAAEDGRVTSAERAILERLRDQLDLEEGLAQLLEDEVTAVGLGGSSDQGVPDPVAC